MANAAQTDFAERFKGYLHNVKNQSAVLFAITKQFAELNLAYIAEIKERVAVVVRARSDQQLTLESKMLTLIEMANSMGRYADAAENFEASFIAAFSAFIESVLGAAAISIAFPAAQTKPLSHVLVQLRGNLRPVYTSMGDFIDHLAKFRLQRSGSILTSAERSIAALGKFREHVRFGELMLLESEKLLAAFCRSRPALGLAERFPSIVFRAQQHFQSGRSLQIGQQIVGKSLMINVM
jgi:hypothetical protein